MKLIKNDTFGTRYYLEVTKNCIIHLNNDWVQLFGKWNWISFHFIYIYFEKDNIGGNYEFEFNLLGLGFRVVYMMKNSLFRKENYETNNHNRR